MGKRAQYAANLAQHVRSYLSSKSETPPTLEILTQLLETLFFASLRHEESQPTLCRVAFIDRHNPDPSPPKRIVADRWKFFALSKDLPFTVPTLVKLSQAVDPWGSTLAVDTDRKGRLRIWGLIDQSIHFSTFLVKEASTGAEMPGLFQAVISGVGEISAYKTNVLIGTLKQESLVTHQHRVFETGPIYSKMLPWVKAYQEKVRKQAEKAAYESRDHWDDSLEDLWFSAICRLLIGIQRYGHGGAVLVSDEIDDLKPKYSLEYPRLADALVRFGVHEINKTFYSDEIFETYIDQDVDDMPVGLYLDESVTADEFEDTNSEIKGCVRFLTSLSRVDGLLWLNSNLFLRGFGVEITLQKDPSKAFAAQNSDGTKRRALIPSHLGMRHRSMFRYCGSHPNAIGFVVSQDGDIRAMTKVGGAVLLWDRVRLHSVRTPRVKESSHRKRKP
jgi:hypothetical protein